jgi:hypothetical protein
MELWNPVLKYSVFLFRPGKTPNLYTDQATEWTTEEWWFGLW